MDGSRTRLEVGSYEITLDAHQDIGLAAVELYAEANHLEFGEVDEAELVLAWSNGLVMPVSAYTDREAIAEAMVDEEEDYDELPIYTAYVQDEA